MKTASDSRCWSGCERGMAGNCSDFHINAYEGAAGSLLTTHGATAPAIINFVCPDPYLSGGHEYVCSYDYYNSQGVTNGQWTISGTSMHPTGPMIHRFCQNGQSISVGVTVTNPYGSDTETASFTCPQ